MQKELKKTLLKAAIVIIGILVFFGLDYMLGWSKNKEIKGLSREASVLQGEVDDLQLKVTTARQNVIAAELDNKVSLNTATNIEWLILNSDYTDMFFRYPADWQLEMDEENYINQKIIVSKGGYSLNITSNVIGIEVLPTKPITSREVEVAEMNLYRREVGNELNTVEDQENYQFETVGGIISINYADSEYTTNFTQNGIIYTIEYAFPADEVGTDRFNEKMELLDEIVSTIGFI